MKLSLKMNVGMSAFLAIVCFAVAASGFASLGDIVEADQRADAWGFAWFWAFLGLVCVAFGVLGAWLVRTQPEEP